MRHYLFYLGANQSFEADHAWQNFVHNVLAWNVLTTVDFVTLPRVIPIPEISDLIIDQDEVSFGIFIEDPNGVIDTTTLVANIIVDGVIVQTADIQDYTVYFDQNLIHFEACLL